MRERVAPSQILQLLPSLRERSNLLAFTSTSVTTLACDSCETSDVQLEDWISVHSISKAIREKPPSHCRISTLRKFHFGLAACRTMFPRRISSRAFSIPTCSSTHSLTDLRRRQSIWSALGLPAHSPQPSADMSSSSGHESIQNQDSRYIYQVQIRRTG